MIGVQECFSFKNDGEWFNILDEHLGNRYCKLVTVSLRDIHIAVFVRKELEPFISAVETSLKATGIANVVGNKGGVGRGIL